MIEVGRALLSESFLPRAFHCVFMVKTSFRLLALRVLFVLILYTGGMPEPLSADAVRTIARLSRLSLSDAELERARGDLTGVLAYVERISTLDLGGVEPLTHVGDAVNRLDADVPMEPLAIGALARMAPSFGDRFIAVPKVLDDGAGA